MKTNFITCISVILITGIGPVIADESADQAATQPPQMIQSPPTWLEAVQAQRLARMEAVRKRQESTRAKIDEHAKALRDAARARSTELNESLPPPPNLDLHFQQQRKDMEARAEALRQDHERRMNEEPRNQGYWAPPYGWSNPWYYRGY